MTSMCLNALKKVEDELRESECRYRAVVEQAAEGIVLFDVDSNRALEANVACQNLLGYTPEAILRLTKEGLELVKDVRLSHKGLAKARANALEMERHAYEIKEYYRKTKPAKPTL